MPTVYAEALEPFNGMELAEGDDMYEPRLKNRVASDIKSCSL